uniref:Peptidyl-prolyl cis-trans isomerase n=1 Tax=Rhizophora mucronata TaxID=61149 RepID=A0A2P2KS60_RHIMU
MKWFLSFVQVKQKQSIHLTAKRCTTFSNKHPLLLFLCNLIIKRQPPLPKYLIDVTFTYVSV